MKSDENIERVWNLVGSDNHVVIRTLNNVRSWPKIWTCEWCVCVCGDSGQNIGTQPQKEKSWKYSLTVLKKLENYPNIWTVLLVVIIHAIALWS